MKKIFLLLSTLILLVCLGGCGGDPADVPIDGTYKIHYTNPKDHKEVNIALEVKHKKDNIYDINFYTLDDKDTDFSRAYGIKDTAVWDEENRTLNYGGVPLLVFSWSEYNIFNRAPLRWIFSVEASTMMQGERVKAYK